MGASAPAWLVPAFVRSVRAIGATAHLSAIEEEAESLIERWSTSDRHFHGLVHLASVLERVDTLAQETHHPDVVRVAAWYHGAVFDTSMLRQYKRAAGENKVESADLAQRHLQGLGVPEQVARRVHDLILSLIRHDSDPADVDAGALCDADLGTIATEPQKYKLYRSRVREEFTHVPTRDYVEARIAIATKLLARRQIFRSPLAQSWEGAARQNLEAELVLLRSELAKLPARDEGDESIADVPVLRPLRSTAAEDTAVSQNGEEQRAHVERFGRDEATRQARPADEGTTANPAAHTGAPARGEDAELIGVPFEERAEAAERPDAPSSGIETEPFTPGDLPLRGALYREVARKQELADDSGSSEGGHEDSSHGAGEVPHDSAATHAAKQPKRGREKSTPDTDDDQSTGSLFRPIEPW